MHCVDCTLGREYHSLFFSRAIRSFLLLRVLRFTPPEAYICHASFVALLLSTIPRETSPSGRSDESTRNQVDDRRNDRNPQFSRGGAKLYERNYNLPHCSAFSLELLNDAFLKPNKRFFVSGRLNRRSNLVSHLFFVFSWGIMLSVKIDLEGA